MKRLKKTALCVIAVVMLSFTAVSCGNVFVNSADSARTNESTNAGNENNSSEFYEKVADKIDICVSVIGASDEQSDLVTTLERIRPSVVEIYSTTSKGVSSGSGVVINLSDTDDNGVTDTGFIVTCHHVIDGATSTTVKSIEGVEYSARLIGSDPKSDIAVICINSSINKPLTELSAASWYEDSDKLKVGMDVVAIGNPLGILGGTVSKGIISSINRDVLVEGKSMSL
ncbi:MAG: trypsin-like peptidase domain-containing protein, partial [Clostridia bacterium]|nr:trypsin-like peptidase domain-containing protein [Clostridia bacterium]